MYNGGKLVQEMGDWEVSLIMGGRGGPVKFANLCAEKSAILEQY